MLTLDQTPCCLTKKRLIVPIMITNDYPIRTKEVKTFVRVLQWKYPVGKTKPRGISFINRFRTHESVKKRSALKMAYSWPSSWNLFLYTVHNKLLIRKLSAFSREVVSFRHDFFMFIFCCFLSPCQRSNYMSSINA